LSTPSRLRDHVRFDVDAQDLPNMWRQPESYLAGPRAEVENPIIHPPSEPRHDERNELAAEFRAVLGVIPRRAPVRPRAFEAAVRHMTLRVQLITLLPAVQRSVLELVACCR